MPTALHTAAPTSQSHQGVGARLVRRLGGAVRSAIGSSINLAAALRRPPASQASPDHAAAQHPQAPVPSRVPLPRRPPRARPLPFLLPHWLAPLLAHYRRRPASENRRAFPNHGDTPFTPEAYPQLSPKACAVLNTPLKDCDPKTLELLFSAFSQHISELMSPEAGITDPAATLPALLHRLNTALGDAKADTSLPATPGAVSVTPGDAVPDAPAVSPHPPAPPAGPTRPSAKDAPRLPPLPLSDPPNDATITAAARETPPDIAALSARSRSFRCDTQSFARHRRRHVRCPSRHGRPIGPTCAGHLPPVSARQYRRQSVIPYRYAACTGPP